MTFRQTAACSARILLGAVILTVFAGCSHKSAEAIVLEKEHIAAVEVPATPAATPNEISASPIPSPEEETEETPRELKPGEIVVHGYVMAKEARGTSKDPRALANEQWLVRVKLISDGRRIDVHSDRPHYEKVKPGDHLEVSYREGKYTGTIWSAEIE